MKKTLCALALLGAAAAAFAGDVPFVSNARGVAARVQVQYGGLSEDQSNRLDLITSAAAARAVLALRCESARFDAISRSTEGRLAAKVSMAVEGPEALAYARESARMKYKAMAIANQGLSCAELDRLRDIAYSEGFYGDSESR